MTNLNDDEREKSKVSQKHPEQWGRIKQKAMDLGISPTELILMADPAREQVKPSADESKVSEGLRELKELLTKREEPPPQPQLPPDPWQQMKSMMEAISAIRGLFPQQKTSDMIAELKALKDLQGEVYGEVEAPDPIESMGMKILEAQLLQRGQQSSSNDSGHTSEVTPLRPAAPAKAEEVAQVEIPSDEEIIQQLPPVVKNGIKEGVITKMQVVHHADREGWPREVAERIYDRIREGEPESRPSSVPDDGKAPVRGESEVSEGGGRGQSKTGVELPEEERDQGP